MAIDARQVAANARRALQGEAKESHKIERDAFLYFDPKPPKDIFASCGACAMWTGPKHETCTIHGKDVLVKAGDSCNLYVHGEPMPEEAGHEMKLVTKEESGFVSRPVRCENCAAFDARGSKCKLFATLNKKLGNLFDLEEEVHPQGCCNAQKAKHNPGNTYAY